MSVTRPSGNPPRPDPEKREVFEASNPPQPQLFGLESEPGRDLKNPAFAFVGDNDGKSEFCIKRLRKSFLSFHFPMRSAIWARTFFPNLEKTRKKTCGSGSE